MSKVQNSNVTVFYDGACPICTKEIGYYKQCDGAENNQWIDVSKLDQEEVYPGLSRDKALSRFHVVTANGDLVSGGPAFAKLWTSLRRFRIIGRLFSFPPLAWLLDRIYDVLLVIRPSLQRLFKA